MARKLKVFQTSLAFFDLTIAAPSVRLGSLGPGQQSLPSGCCKESDDPNVVAATRRSLE
jgi:hypothetical protein